MLRKREHVRRWYRRVLELRRRTYALLEHGPASDHASVFVDRILIGLIIINIAAVILDSVPSLAKHYRLAFVIIELVSLVVFSVEFFLRVWTAPEHALYRKLPRWKARWRYIMSPVGLVDLFAVLPFWFAFIVSEELRVILVFRIVRFLKLARYSPGMRSLFDALHAERRALVACLVIFFGATLFAAMAMHLAERHAQPDKLGTLPDAIWWAFVTLATIGYGDVVPITLVGKVVAAVTILVAIAMIALPVGIIANAFSEEIHRRDFVVTWGMVARVPLFAELDAAKIAGIMRLLRAQVIEPGVVIARRGEPAHSMYFIARGAVEIKLTDRRVTLAAGHFFGEIAVLRRARRSATVTALSRVNLLVLNGDDLHRLMAHDKVIAESIHAVVRERLGTDLITRMGDMVTEEIAQGNEQPPQ